MESRKLFLVAVGSNMTGLHVKLKRSRGDVFFFVDEIWHAVLEWTVMTGTLITSREIFGLHATKIPHLQ